MSDYVPSWVRKPDPRLLHWERVFALGYQHERRRTDKAMADAAKVVDNWLAIIARRT